MDAVSQAGAVARAKSGTWILVFIFCFLGLLIDGADLMLLSYSLNSLKAEFGLTNVEAGSLGSFTWPEWQSAEFTAAGLVTVSAGSKRWFGASCCSPSVPLPWA